MVNRIFNKVEEVLNERIVDSVKQGGGCIADAQIITSSSSNKYFLKHGFSNRMFQCEANGLNEMRKSNTLKVPSVIYADNDFLLLENIEQGINNNAAMYNFGCDFARMHKYIGSAYGFYEDNFIGATLQVNSVSQNWVDFYLNNRLIKQFKLAEKNGYVNTEFTHKFMRLEKLLPDILEGSEEAPSLLHGDLWAGNYMISLEGKAVLIDPAVYYGHREADLAMTKLFGGFSDEFYNGYKTTFPLKDGYAYRENIYLLYHVLNHLNLFGSGYYSQALQLVDFYV